MNSPEQQKSSIFDTRLKYKMGKKRAYIVEFAQSASTSKHDKTVEHLRNILLKHRLVDFLTVLHLLILYLVVVLILLYLLLAGAGGCVSRLHYIW